MPPKIQLTLVAIFFAPCLIAVARSNVLYGRMIEALNETGDPVSPLWNYPGKSIRVRSSYREKFGDDANLRGYRTARLWFAAFGVLSVFFLLFGQSL